MGYTDNYPFYPFFLSGPCGPIGWGCGWPMPAKSSMPPSSTPPWDRDPISAITATMVAAGNIDLTFNTTFFMQTLNTPSLPVAITLPNGTFVNQSIRLYIRGDMLPTTEDFIVAGQFAGGFSHLKFNGIGFSAILIWDGAFWQLVGGNAELQA
jgi:hypothetical protein